jgi:hypothetical protein
MVRLNENDIQTVSLLFLLFLKEGTCLKLHPKTFFLAIVMGAFFCSLFRQKLLTFGEDDHGKTKKKCPISDLLQNYFRVKKDYVMWFTFYWWNYFVVENKVETYGDKRFSNGVVPINGKGRQVSFYLK